MYRLAPDSAELDTDPSFLPSTSSRTRTRSEFEQQQRDGTSNLGRPSNSSSHRVHSDEDQHARKKRKHDKGLVSSHLSTEYFSPRSVSEMRLVDSAENDSASTLSVSLNSESSCENLITQEVTYGSDSLSQDPTTWRSDVSILTNGNGISTNGLKHNGKEDGKIVTHSISRVVLPGMRLYEDSCIDREEFVRLVIQSLRDVGYTESASTLEAESGYKMETPDVSLFRSYIHKGQWNEAENCLDRLGIKGEEHRRIFRFLISQQKYLELLESQNVNTALHVLRNELAVFTANQDELHSLSSLIMCSSAEDLRIRAKWDGSKETSRKVLLSQLQQLIPPSTMLPERRFSAVIEQAFTYQRTHCLYHNVPYTPESFSLYTDHQCSRDDFPLLTTNILKQHTDEVWYISWSHDGQYLASASKDQRAFIWRIGPETEPNVRDCSLERRLNEHQYPVGYVAWSPDDKILLTSADSVIKLWNPKTGECIRELNAHEDMVSALEWLPDGTGFLSGGMDRKILLWDAVDHHEELWIKTTIRVTDLALASDLSRLVVIGLEPLPISQPKLSSQQDVQNSGVPSSSQQSVNSKENRLIIYDFASKKQEASIRLEGELTSVKISQDSRFALVNHAPDEVQLWDLESGRMARKFTGQRQGQHVIRSCFGGIDGNFVVSGSEDEKVYIWHRDTGVLLEAIPGHGAGSVNAVAWNPVNERLFASCSDDGTVRIWESPHADLLLAGVSVESSTSYTMDRSKKGKGRETTL